MGSPPSMPRSMKRLSVFSSTSISSSAFPLLSVQQPLQSESAHVSRATTTIDLPDFGSFRQSAWYASFLLSGNTETMLCVFTHDSGIVLLQFSNCPSYWQPLNWMHSGLFGGG